MLKVYNSLGSLVQIKKYRDGSNVVVPVAELEAGLYSVSIVVGHNSFVKNLTFIKQ